jgi:hypothetical protein
MPTLRTKRRGAGAIGGEGGDKRRCERSRPHDGGRGRGQVQEQCRGAARRSQERRKGHAIAASQRMDALLLAGGVACNPEVGVSVRLRPKLRHYENQGLRQAKDRVV